MCWTDKLYFSHKRVQLYPQRWPQNRLSCSQNRLTHFLRLEDKGTQAWRFWWLIPRHGSTNSVLNRLLAKIWAQNNLFREREEGRWANWHEAAENNGSVDRAEGCGQGFLVSRRGVCIFPAFNFSPHTLLHDAVVPSGKAESKLFFLSSLDDAVKCYMLWHCSLGNKKAHHGILENCSRPRLSSGQ